MSPGPAFLCVSLITLALECRVALAEGKTANKPRELHQVSAPEKSEVSAELVEIVQAFIAAGEKSDPAARGKYLGPNVFYYGHSLTRTQALRQITSLYRQWPTRKFGPVESIDLFEIPKHPGMYKVTAVYEYNFDNMDEHLNGKSKLTCVVEHDSQGSRIIGVDEKLVREGTQYRKE